MVEVTGSNPVAPTLSRFRRAAFGVFFSLSIVDFSLRMPKRFSAARGAALAIAAVAVAVGLAVGISRLDPTRFLAINLAAVDARAGSALARSLAARVQTPPEFEIGVFADSVERARQIAVGDDGWIFVGTSGDSVWALKDEDGDGAADIRRKIFSSLTAPHGVAYRDGDLFIGEIPRVLVARGIEAQMESAAPPRASVFIDGLPTSAHHGMRPLEIDGEFLFVGLGVPCNICAPPDPELTALIRRYPLSSPRPLRATEGEAYARGVRNSVGFDFHPRSGELWFTDNGRDWLGDDAPHDELNRAARAGLHFGFPHCHQGDLSDPEFGVDSGGRACADFTAPALNTGAHVANLGMAFYRPRGENRFPPAYDDAVFIALHGSWNRSEKVGYAVWAADIKDGARALNYRPFASGWLDSEGEVSGRPVDVAVAADGALLISDDAAGAVYRVAPRAER